MVAAEKLDTVSVRVSSISKLLRQHRQAHEAEPDGTLLAAAAGGGGDDSDADVMLVDAVGQQPAANGLTDDVAIDAEPGTQ